ncbi:MAG: methyltransferase [Betaproteobacteria bacterium]
MIKQDPALPEFWERRFREGTTPWDAGRTPARLEQFLATEKPGRVLIPGCGSGYEIRAFFNAGWDVLAIDFAPAAIERARIELRDLPDCLLQADFFNFAAPPVDLLYERAFLCALPRHLWIDYAGRMEALLQPGGRIAGFYFFSDELRGPPFGLAAGQLSSLLETGFTCGVDEAVEDSLPVFAGRERWQVWTRR